MFYYHHSLSIDATIRVSKNCPITGEHVGIISARWNFFLLWNFDKQSEMQLLAKFKQILYMGFRATLNFRKFKVPLNPMYRIALNVSLNLSIYYSFRHVLKPGTPEHHKGRFTRYDFVAYNKLATGLRHDLDLHDNRKRVVGLIYKKQFMS